MKRLALAILCIAVSGCMTSPERVDLEATERKEFAQWGEDGVLEKIFEIIPPTTKYAVEFGAYDGVINSNTRNLILNHGWGGYQIEGHPGRAKKLEQLYADNPKVTTRHAWIWPGNIELLFEEAGVPKDLDLLVIDIDSNDYYVWRAITEYRPKVVLIEANHAFPPPQLAVVDYHPMNYWDGTNYVGASLQSVYELGKKKGYELVHVMRTGPNAVFVDKKYFARFGIDDNSPSAMYTPRGNPQPNPTEYPDDKKWLEIDAFKVKKQWILDR